MKLIKHFLTNNPCYLANVKKADSRYTTFQNRGPIGLMLHSVGCAQPNASVFLKKWNKSTNYSSCVHGVIDANTGVAYQCLPWNYRGWHGGGSSNNTHIGVEMCESGYVRYGLGAKFKVLDLAKARADCKRCYDTAVELFASLCEQYNLNPLTAICSHKEGGAMGIASRHVDPEHYWNGLGMSYTMDGFRADVKRTMDGSSSTPTPKPNNKFEIGDVVKIVGTKYYSGATVPDWVRSKRWIVKSVSGDRVVVNESEDGSAAIMSPFHANDLKNLSKPAIISIGDLVKITGKKYYSGARIPEWVLSRNWYVFKATDNSDRIVINKSEDGKCEIMSSINRADLKIVDNG